MDWFLEHDYVIALIPAASFFLILFFGKRLPYKGAEIGIAALGICFAMAVTTNVQWREYVNDSEHAEEALHEVEEGAEVPAAEEESEEPAAEAGESAEEGEAHGFTRGFFNGACPLKVVKVRRRESWAGGVYFDARRLKSHSEGECDRVEGCLRGAVCTEHLAVRVCEVRVPGERAALARYVDDTPGRAFKEEW